GRGAVASCPTRQLVALSFFLEAMQRWPRLAIKLMRDVGAWDVLFSEHFLDGGSSIIADTIDFMESPDVETPAAGAPGGADCDSGDDCDRGLDDAVVGWVLVHDATLVLLEAVNV
ncbi:unnamed protein product, partial [Sphacelaria rigidula]